MQSLTKKNAMNKYLIFKFVCQCWREKLDEIVKQIKGQGPEHAPKAYSWTTLPNTYSWNAVRGDSSGFTWEETMFWIAMLIGQPGHDMFKVMWSDFETFHDPVFCKTSFLLRVEFSLFFSEADNSGHHGVDKIA